MSALAKTAKVVEDLVDYDGPQLLLLKTNRKRHMLATAVPEYPNLEEPFFSAEIRDKTYDQYFDEKADLHFVFDQAIGKNYYLFDLATAEDNTVELKRVTEQEASNPSFWPQVGFFSRSHTTGFNRIKTSSVIQSFRIDGKWGTNDFSHFNAKISDLYGLFGVLGRLEGVNSKTEMGFIRHTIQERFWQGGGSYVGFYDSLIDRNRLLRLAPLEVAKIQYASPGEIALRGNKRALSDVSSILDVFDEKRDALAMSYRNIRGSLRKEGLLSAEPTTPFSSNTMRDFIRNKTREFAEQMRLERIDDIYDACDRNPLVFAKVILSIFRRADELYKFHAEGRVQRL
jgi:hypothetical protein